MGVARYIKDKKGGIVDVILESGIHVKPVYTPEDLPGWDYARDLGNPGGIPLHSGNP